MKKNKEIDNFELTSEMQEVLTFLESDRKSIFLTGKAGSGKSTFLNYIRNKSKKNLAVVAPTGVAAQNIKAQTIHSFFGFRYNVDLKTVKKFNNLEKILKKLELLVIDEISMVRADLFDCINKSLQIHRNSPLPFGGVQLLLIGDLYQLPPVLTKEDIEFIKEYKSPYFFNAKTEIDLEYFELTNIFRQEDYQFINFLNSLRTGEIDEYDFEYSKTFVRKKSDNENLVYIVSTNALADKINQDKLSELGTKEKTYYAEIKDNFEFKTLPVDNSLTLKLGAKVMLLNNDLEKRWVNGDIGEITELNAKTVSVKINNKIYEVEPHTWESVKYVLDGEQISAQITGKFSQLPLKLAWATTVHKSQGKTLTNIHLDFGRGVFAPGQAYVAFSRAKSPEGISIARELTNRDIIVDYRINEFIDDLKRNK